MLFVKSLQYAVFRVFVPTHCLKYSPGQCSVLKLTRKKWRAIPVFLERLSQRINFRKCLIIGHPVTMIQCGGQD